MNTQFCDYCSMPVRRVSEAKEKERFALNAVTYCFFFVVCVTIVFTAVLILLVSVLTSVDTSYNPSDLILYDLISSVVICCAVAKCCRTYCILIGHSHGELGRFIAIKLR